jgi:hypothetical protein
MKVTPMVLAWWLLCERRWRALVGFAIGGLAITMVSLAGAGVDAHIRFIEIARHTSSDGVSPISLAGLVVNSGLSRPIAIAIPIVVGITGLAAVWILRDRRNLSFSIAACLMVVVSPVVYFHTLALLVVALVPLRRGQADSPAGASSAAEHVRPATTS